MRDEEAPGPLTQASAPQAPGRLGGEDVRTLRDRASSRIYLIRHADVENPRGLLYGHLPGFHLSVRGRAQSAALGERLRSEAVTRIVHSPLDRARETAEILAGELTPSPAMESDPDLVEAEFSRYLQGVPYWQIPVRRPLWVVHKAKRGLLPGDEPIQVMGERILRVVRRLAREHPEETMAVVSHADPLNAAWILLDDRPQNEREMHRKSIAKAGMLRLDLEGDAPQAWEYIAPPRVEKPASAAA